MDDHRTLRVHEPEPDGLVRGLGNHELDHIAREYRAHGGDHAAILVSPEGWCCADLAELGVTT